MSKSIDEEAILLHQKHQGKLKTAAVQVITNKKDLSLVYTPGVAAPCREIATDKDRSFDLTWRGRTIAVISDGSAVLGLGNIGPEAALPVMEGKSLLLNQFAGVDSVPLVINTQDTSEIISFIKLVAPSFAGINIEDISAPRCFEVEDALQDIDIPVFHDDQHGTAIVVTAALKNAAKVVGKDFRDLNVVIIGSGAAGLAIAKMLAGLRCTGDSCEELDSPHHVRDVIIVDSKGIIHSSRDDLNAYKKGIAFSTNKKDISGSKEDAIKKADVVIGVSRPGTITPEMIGDMAKQPIVFALANPTPEIMPDDAKAAGAAIVATGRSDYPNQINNVLAFPAIFKAVVEGRLTKITPAMKSSAAIALSNAIDAPEENKVIPDPFTPGLADKISQAILKTNDAKKYARNHDSKK